jgi:DNA processing protein
MDEFKEKLISLLHYPNISWSTVLQVLKKDPTLKDLYQLQIQSPQQTCLFPPTNSNNPSEKPSSISLHPDIIRDQIRQYKTNEITVITILD